MRGFERKLTLVTCRNVALAGPRARDRKLLISRHHGLSSGGEGGAASTRHPARTLWAPRCQRPSCSRTLSALQMDVPKRGPCLCDTFAFEDRDELVSLYLGNVLDCAAGPSN